jgi:hypothetical protein
MAFNTSDSIKKLLFKQSVLCLWQNKAFGHKCFKMPNTLYLISVYSTRYTMATLFHVTIIKSPRDQPPPRNTKV